MCFEFLIHGGESLRNASACQGLLQRADWAEAARLPLCQVPGGSGNALAANCGLWSPVTAAHAICKVCTDRQCASLAGTVIAC